MILKIVISNNNKAKLLMIISALSFSIMAAIVKATYHSVVVKAFSRQVFSCIIVLAIIFINNNRIIPLKKNRIKLILRCLFGTLGIYLYFYSIDNLLLANASMLTRLSPFFVTLFAFSILKETVNSLSWLMFIPMIIGCGFIIKPNTDLFHLASIFAILSACSASLAYIMIKLISKEESAYTIIFWFTLISSVIYFIIAKEELLILDEIQYLSLAMIGLFGVVGQIGLTFSYQLTKASHVAPYSYFYIIFSGLLGYYIWNEIPDILSIAGYCLISISFYYLMRLYKKSLIV